MQPPVLASILVSAGEPAPDDYGRGGNPTWTTLEQALGAIEDAEAVLFASGQAASMALMLALARGRDAIVLPHDGYYNARALADRLRPYSAEPVLVDLQDLAAVKRALAGPAGGAVLWAETPTNPLLRVADLAALGRLAAAAGAPMIVDNTVATGLLQRPLDLGAVASLCSLTKSASGHSDVILGAVLTRDPALASELRSWRTLGGGIAGPDESLAGDPRAEDAAAPDRAAVGDGAHDCPASRGPPAGQRRALSGHQSGHARGRPRADAARLRPAAVVRAGRHRRGGRRRRRGRPADRAGHKFRRGGVDLGTAGQMARRDGPGLADPAFGRHRAGR